MASSVIGTDCIAWTPFLGVSYIEKRIRKAEIPMLPVTHGWSLLNPPYWVIPYYLTYLFNAILGRHVGLIYLICSTILNYLFVSRLEIKV